MVPATTFGVVTFFLFVAPGTCYELLRGRTKLPREETAFVHVSRVLLAGTIITALTALLLAIVRWVSPSSVLDLGALLDQGTHYVSGHLGLVGWTILTQLAVSTLLAVIASDLLSPKEAPPIFQGSTWHVMAEQMRKPQQRVDVSVRLKSGRDIVGRYVGASTELDPAKRELLLGVPLEVRDATSGTTITLDRGWEVLVISGAEVESVAAAYIGEGAMLPPPKRRFSTQLEWVKTNYLSWKVATAAVIVLLFAVMVG